MNHLNQTIHRVGGSLSLAALLTLTIDIVSLAMIYESSEWIVGRVGLIGKSWFYLLLMAAKGIRDRARLLLLGGEISSRTDTGSVNSKVNRQNGSGVIKRSRSNGDPLR